VRFTDVFQEGLKVCKLELAARKIPPLKTGEHVTRVGGPPTYEFTLEGIESLWGSVVALWVCQAQELALYEVGTPTKFA
jgi:hypothetical protein